MKDLFQQHPFFAADPEPGSGGGAAAKKEDPPKIKTEDAIAVIQGDDNYVVMTVAEYKTKEQKTRKDEAINTVGKTHGIYDKLFNELSGLEKESDEKTVDFGKRIIKHLESEAQGEPNDRVKTLEHSLEVSLGKLDELRGSLDEKEDEHKKELLKRDISSEYQAGLFEVMPKLGYEDDNEKRLALRGFESEFFSTYDISLENGEKQVKEKSTGKVLQDDKLINMTPSQVVQEFAQKLLKFNKGASKGGAGTKSPSNNGMPALTTIGELDDWLEAKYKEKKGGPEWVAERTKLRKELAL